MNELTDELQISLEKLHETEVELRTVKRSESNSQLLPKNDGGTGGLDGNLSYHSFFSLCVVSVWGVHGTIEVCGDRVS